jgi:hypothetical protein
LNRSVGAKAFTLGSDIFLSQAATSAGRYGGDALLAHELTHVAQQRDAGQSERLTVGPASNGHEREADAVARAIPQGGISKNTIGTVPETVVQRAPDPMVPDAISGADRATLKPGWHAAMEREFAVLRKRQQADELDAEWRAKFGKKLASYEQAIWRVTGGIDAANQGFQTAQAAQARANQMWAQLFGLGLSVVFAGGFEWVALKGLGRLGSKLKSAPADIVEKIENPANALFGGLVTNVRTTYIANRDAEQGEVPAVTGGGGGAMG